LVGGVTESESIEEFDPNFDMILKYFSDEAEFRQKVKLLTDGPVIVKGSVNFMSCDDKRCLPPEDVEFEFPYKGASTQIETSEIALQDGEYKPTTLIIEDKAILEEMKIEELEYSSIWELFIFALIAGLIAILTPCVFPMIPMTVSFFMHDGDNKAKAKFQAIIFGLSIIFIYTVIGTVIALTLGVNFANWLSTHWIPNVLFFLIFVIFAASFFGMFEITLFRDVRDHPAKLDDQQIRSAGRTGRHHRAILYGIYPGTGFIFLYRTTGWYSAGAISHRGMA
jgi:thiol:disulfide interchange protein DsbD